MHAKNMEATSSKKKKRKGKKKKKKRIQNGWEGPRDREPGEKE